MEKVKKLLPLQPGSEEAESFERGVSEEREWKNKGLKNKNYFVWKFGKDSYLCTPNRKEGKRLPELRMQGREKKRSKRTDGAGEY
ncbi:hypothetical protein ACFOG5_17950 [Pedobacter fastidiosus]|uniref:hypothetical protein n=1 Tax=Pedobacter fastidiosus TaxID=2765361 RepID=UPI0036213B8A